MSLPADVQIAHDKEQKLIVVQDLAKNYIKLQFGNNDSHSENYLNTSRSFYLAILLKQA